MTARRALGKFNGISLALAAALGARQLSVRRPLRVGLFSTGNELREPGEPPSAAQIHDSNRTLLIGPPRRMGVEACRIARSST
jgi:molybdopterin molybdotransferase